MAVDMFMKMDGIDGESQDSKHDKWIDLLSWSVGLTQSGNMHMGGGGGAGKVSMSDFNFVKYSDKASTELFLHCCNGKHIPKVEVEVRKAGEKPLTYMKWTLEDVIVTSLQMGGSGGEDRLVEQVSISAAKTTLEYTPQKADGSADATKKNGWDMKKNEAA